MYQADGTRYETNEVQPLWKERTQAPGGVTGVVAQFWKHCCL